MTQRSTFLLFGIAYIASHFIVLAIFLVPLLPNEKLLSVGDTNNIPLQISMNFGSTNSLNDKSVAVVQQPASTPKNTSEIKQQNLSPHHLPRKTIIKSADTRKNDLDSTNIGNNVQQQIKEHILINNSVIPNHKSVDTSGTPDSPDTSASSLARTKEQSAVIQTKLNAAINKHFSYPRFAVTRGWQGTVEIGLRIEADGKLSKVRVVKTSGYSILDEAALTTLSKTNHINGLESWMAGQYFDTTLPVKYLLIDG